MTAKIRWGLIGTGAMAHRCAAALSSLDDAEVAAVGSRSLSQAQRFGDTFGIPRRHGSTQDLAQDSDIDVIYIATPPALHAAQVRMCLEAGTPVLCERPFAINSREAEPVIALAREKGLFLMEAMWTRTLPATETLKEWLAKKMIGKVEMVVGGGGYAQSGAPGPSLFNLETGGGVLLNRGVDLVAMISLILGRPATMTSMGSLNERDIDDQEMVLLGYSGGRMANLTLSSKIDWPPDLTILGDAGSIKVHAPLTCPPALTLTTGAGTHTTTFDEPHDGMTSGAAEVMRCLREGRLESDLMPLDETVRLLDILNEIRLQIGLRFPTE